jgi:hypothetical protein
LRALTARQWHSLPARVKNLKLNGLNADAARGDNVPVMLRATMR